MYPECVRCPKLGKSCDGPNFILTSPDKLIEWVKERKKHLGLTNEKLAELSGVAPGTIASVLAGRRADFKVGTIQPIMLALIGGERTGTPCPDPTGRHDAELREEIARLKEDNERQEKRLAEFAAEVDLLRNHNAQTARNNEQAAERYETSLNFLRSRIKSRDKTVKVLGALLLLAWLIILSKYITA